MIFSLLKRRKTGVKLRVALGGIMIAVAALFALAVSYDISVREMSVYLLGSLALLLKRVLGVIFGPLIRRLVAIDDQDHDD